MSTFFHGWRRKLGCALLLLTCVITVIWARSCMVIDNFAMPLGNRRLQVAVLRGDVYWETLNVPTWGKSTIPPRVVPSYRWHVRLLDPTIQSTSWTLQGPVKCVPFRHLVAVFGSLAAYLILSKPRKIASTSPKPET